ncbi:hypothetical protein BGZ52_005072 [Haplosporangium bisporale]|nr:hypothetical protein BGZ52_005072 [Haplosporangium bisporale]
MTWKPTSDAIGHDALQHRWRPLGNVYLCPPWNLIPLALQKYSTIQDRYIKWATARGVDALAPQPEQLLNWLASGVSINNWSSGTVQAYKAAVIHMSHDDLFLCPVKTLSEYLRRIQEYEITVAHPKDSSIQYRPLIRDTRDFNKPIGAEHISKHISNISRLISLPTDAKMPKARAIGSTAAIKQGATVDDVVVHGNWSSSILFDKFY